MVAARLMETFAGYTAQTDHEVGRADRRARRDRPDSTTRWSSGMIGDNGASLEGSLHGTVQRDGRRCSGVTEDPQATLLKHRRDRRAERLQPLPGRLGLGDEHAVPVGKQVASHFGGTRNPLVVSWPQRIKDTGGVRTQFHHVIDIAPTILEAAGIPEPAIGQRRGAEADRGRQHGLHASTTRRRKSTRQTQYFEMFGNRAHLSRRLDRGLPARPAAVETPAPSTSTDDVGALQHRRRLQRVDDLAAQEPAEAQGAAGPVLAEAGKYNVLPLDDRFIERADPALRPSLIEGRTEFTYYAGVCRVAGELVAEHEEPVAHDHR